MLEAHAFYSTRGDFSTVTRARLAHAKRAGYTGPRRSESGSGLVRTQVTIADLNPGLRKVHKTPSRGSCRAPY